MKKTVSYILYPLRLFFRLLVAVFGHFKWSPPLWAQRMSLLQRKYPAQVWGALFLSILSLIAYLQYRAAPMAAQFVAVIQAPEITPNTDILVPESLGIVFELEKSESVESAPGQDLPGNASVASLETLDRSLNDFIQMRPNLVGEWRWKDDNHLVFIPKQDWPAGQKFSVEMDESIFSPEIKLKKRKYEFETPSFNAEIVKAGLYKDPAKKNSRHVTVNFRFSHSVDELSFKRSLTIFIREHTGNGGEKSKNIDFDVRFDKHYREAYVRSKALTLGDKENYAFIQLKPDVLTHDKTRNTKKEVRDRVLIPDIYSFLKVESVNAQIIRNEYFEPEQIVSLLFTDDISEQEIREHLSLFILPRYYPLARVDEAVLKASEKVRFDIVANERDAVSRHNIRLHVPEGKYIYLSVSKGLKSVDSFRLANSYANIVTSPSYPKEVDIMGEGALVSLSGEKNIGFKSRGVPALRIKVSRLQDNSLNHLVSQTRGDLRNAQFNMEYYFNIDNISKAQEKTIELLNAHPKSANFSSINLDDFSDMKGTGVFLVEAQGWNNRKQYRIGKSDRRLMVVTDLGVIVKRSSDGRQDIFVQSIKTGKPVPGATVKLLGKNGLPVYSGLTDIKGHILFYSTEGIGGAKTPTVYTVQYLHKSSDTGSHLDTTFIPYDRYTRQIEYSRFDISGDYQHGSDDESLSAYVFTDRGLYRPEDAVNIAAIVSQRNFAIKPGLPIAIDITDPRGNRAYYKKIKLPKHGFFDLNFKTIKTSTTGQYSLRVYLLNERGQERQSIGSTSFKVEEFLPDNMEIKTNLEPGPVKGWIVESEIKASVKLKNLFGSPAQNRNVTAKVDIAPTQFQFSAYEGYRFSGFSSRTNAQSLKYSEVLPMTKTDADGLAVFNLPIKHFDQGTYSLSFSAEGKEANGGRGVSARSKALISPLKYIIGYKYDGAIDFLKRGQARSVRLVAIDNALQAVSLEDLKVKHILKKPTSSLVQQYDGTLTYQSVIKDVLVSEKTIGIDSSGMNYTIDTEQPGKFEVVISDQQDRVLNRFEYDVITEGNLSGKIEKNAELTLKLDQQGYAPGDVIEMSITAPYTGAGLITIESDGVHAYKWFAATTKSSAQTIVLPDGLEGNAYVNVTFTRAYDSKDVYTSPLSYAVVPFNIDRRRREVKVSVAAPPLVRPGKPMQIKYKTNVPSKMAIFAVDEGILQVSNYKTPSPLNHFLQKRALQVRTFQTLDLILPEYRLLKNVSGIGGGDSNGLLGSNVNPFKRSVDKPAVYWSGILEADEKERVVEYTPPDSFNGKLRIMAVAVGDGVMGVVTKSALVRGPFVLTPNVLNVAAPGDEFIATLSLANLIETKNEDGSDKKIDIAVALELSDNLSLVDSGKNKISVLEGNEEQISYKIRVRDSLGEGKLIFKASYKNEHLERTATLSVRPPVPYTNTLYTGFTKSGKHTLELDKTLYPHFAYQKAMASNQALVLTDGLMAYLNKYPHGCTEQIVSQVFPWLIVRDDSNASVQRHNTQEKVNRLLAKLRDRHQANGGFGMWPGGRQSHSFASIYVMHFLTEAKDHGYTIPNDLLNGGQEYLRHLAKRKTEDVYAHRIRAMAIYLLTRSGEVTGNYLIDLQQSLNQHKGMLWASDLTAILMASSYNLLQKTDVAKKLLSTYMSSKGGKYTDNDFYSATMMEAQTTYFIAKHFPKAFASISSDEILRLTEKLFGGDYNTIQASYISLALLAYSDKTRQKFGDSDVHFKGILHDGETTELNRSKEAILPTAIFNTDVKTVAFNADTPLFYLAYQSGFERAANKHVVREGIEIKRDFINSDGQIITEAEQGSELFVRLKLRSLSKKTLSNLVITDLLPGGFEVLRASLSRARGYHNIDYVDIREDRTVFYGRVNERVTELKYKVKAVSEGVFTVPSVYARSMYRRGIHASDLPSSFRITTGK